MAEEWVVEFHCPAPEPFGPAHKSEEQACAAAHELAVLMYNIAQTDMAGEENVYQTVMVVRPDGSKFRVFA